MKPDFTAVMQAIARRLEAMGQLERAQRLYQNSVVQFAIALRQLWARLRPNSAWAHYRLGKALVQQERWDAAIAACQRAVQLDPSVAWFHHTLGEAQMGLGNWQAAVEACEQAIALHPDQSWIHYTLAKAHMGQENWTAAIASAQQAIQLDPQVFWFHYSLGEALVKAGQWDEATATLQQAIALQPHFPWTHYYLGDALLAKAETDAAVAAYQRAIEMRPHHDYLRHSLAYALHLQNQSERIRAHAEKSRAFAADDRRLKILMLMPYPPYPPKLGAIARMFHQLKCLGADHHVVVASFIFTKEDYVLEAALEEYCDLALTVMLGDSPPRQPDQPKLIHRYSSLRMRQILTELGAIDFDIVSFNFIYMAQYRDLFPNAFPVLEEHNIESELLKRCAELNQDSTTLNQLAKQVDAVKAFVESDLEAKLLAAYERQHWQAFPLRTVVSEKDKEILDSRCPMGETRVVNNGIDTRSIVPFADNPNKILLFIGTLSYYPNIDGACYFADTILPLVWQIDPEIQFWVAGASPPQQVKDLAQDARIRVIADPEDMEAIAQSCCLTVVPLRVGSGTRIKILHSMAMGLPVVSTSLGCEGLHVTDGEHLLIRDQPEQFAQAIAQLVSDAELRQRLRHSGRQLVEAAYDWQSIFTQSEVALLESFTAWKAAASPEAAIETVGQAV